MTRSRVLVRVLTIVLFVALGAVMQGCGTAVGPEGPAGEDGNANVVAAVVDLTNDDWGDGSYVYQRSPNTVAQVPARTVQVDVPEITQEIYDLGMVHVYMEVPVELTLDPQVAWAPLPHQFRPLTSNYSANTAFTFEVGKLTLYYFHTPLSDDDVYPFPNAVTLPDRAFKYVIASAQAIDALANVGVDASEHDALLHLVAR
jgi:hypothetical protein